MADTEGVPFRIRIARLQGAHEAIDGRQKRLPHAVHVPLDKLFEVPAIAVALAF